jgi:hypothetical protein
MAVWSADYVSSNKNSWGENEERIIQIGQRSPLETLKKE